MYRKRGGFVHPLSTSGGFTLVELAIALMIIGLLIGGILKGKELIENARIVDIYRTAKAYETAVMTFRGIYNGLPGDFIHPNRIPNCTSVVCNVPGDGNRSLGTATVLHMAISHVGTGAAYLDTERRRFFLQLSAAGLITGIDSSNTNTTGIGTPGIEFPATPVGGTYYVWPRINSGSGIYGPASAHYLVVLGGPVSGSPNAPAGLTVKQAQTLDTKFDDGLPGGTGNILSYTPTTASGNCISGSEYDTTNLSGKACETFIMIDAI